LLVDDIFKNDDVMDHVKVSHLILLINTIFGKRSKKQIVKVLDVISNSIEWTWQRNGSVSHKSPRDAITTDPYTMHPAYMQCKKNTI
jgi:hypothetical protein